MNQQKQSSGILNTATLPNVSDLTVALGKRKEEADEQHLNVATHHFSRGRPGKQYFSSLMWREK